MRETEEALEDPDLYPVRFDKVGNGYQDGVDLALTERLRVSGMMTIACIQLYRSLEKYPSQQPASRIFEIQIKPLSCVSKIQTEIKQMQQWWKLVTQSVESNMINDDVEKSMEILPLSYGYLRKLSHQDSSFPHYCDERLASFLWNVLLRKQTLSYGSQFLAEMFDLHKILNKKDRKMLLQILPRTRVAREVNDSEDECNLRRILEKIVAEQNQSQQPASRFFEIQTKPHEAESVNLVTQITDAICKSSDAINSTAGKKEKKKKKKKKKSSPSVEDQEETVVGFNNETKMIMERLAGEGKQLEVISIVGMGGIGKTTLASKVYNDPLIVYHFYTRGWAFVSQVYRKRDVLFRILSSIVKNEDEINKLSEERLGEELYRRLKGKRYLIVVDDVWSIRAWEDLKKSFPNDRNGSRVMLTSRLRDLALQIKPDSPPLCLRFLTLDESWDLLQQKVFGNRSSCPPGLIEIGKHIALKCQGLPLAIVIVAGLLAKKEMKQELWKQVAESVRSNIVNDDAEHLMDILALSYIHLPHHLKSCFLYFGEFPSDSEIPLRRLIWSWIAEGFVPQMGQRSLEDIAEDYLMDLIDRSLVVVSKKRSKGGVKACRVHDMLHDFCLSRAKEKSYLQQIYASHSSPILNSYICFHSHGFHSISGNPCAPHVRSLFWYISSSRDPRPKHTISFIHNVLRVLDLRSIYLNNFPDEILQLSHLRYLELRIRYLKMLSPQISNLLNLETLFIDKGERGAVTIPLTLWSMVNLRHIYISDGIKFEKSSANQSYPFAIDNLQSMYALPFTHSKEDTEIFLARTPNIRKLAFYRGPDESQAFSLPNLFNLTHLVTLKLIDYSLEGPQPSIPHQSKFPPCLKKLTLSGDNIEWKGVFNLGKLPNLEVLKLSRHYFSELRWETNDEEFCRLKYLKLSSIGLRQWITSSTHFPILQQLVVEGCMFLTEIPSCLGHIPTLQMVEISSSSYSATKSALKIRREQHNMGNDGLMFTIIPNEEKRRRLDAGF